MKKILFGSMLLALSLLASGSYQPGCALTVTGWERVIEIEGSYKIVAKEMCGFSVMDEHEQYGENYWHEGEDREEYVVWPDDLHGAEETCNYPEFYRVRYEFRGDFLVRGEYNARYAISYTNATEYEDFFRKEWWIIGVNSQGVGIAMRFFP